jgi:predicted glycosyltransferase
VGNLEDVVDERFGPELPMIRDWTRENFDFAGYITGFDPERLGSREALRAELGYREGETVCIATVGGSGVGGFLLERVVQSFEPARRRIPGLRMIVVTGPRIDASAFAARDGLEIRPYVHNLYRQLAACDIALVQGGLTTCMELAAAGTPFLYFPLKNHFEQNFHVAHRLDRYGAGRRLEFAAASPEVIAEAMLAELYAPRCPAPVEADGAARAARMLAELL